ncbi:MAG TPA: glycosyltransferase family A protein [Verrucomicrobiae bacterium]|jgi:glycosyltransferase involved in cell wall biosynthesis|nr:glycosyltransferase family A protein [Verrucomicrobiae bacterium]
MLVSILIPCYNASPWIGKAIESALGQTWPETEILVLDDGSTDDSMETIRRYASRIQVRHQINSGQNVSRNRLTELARGEWLVFLDADDDLRPDCVEQKMKMVDAADVVYGTIEVACFVGREKTRSSIQLAKDYDDPIAAAFAWKFPNTSAIAFRKSAILEAGGWDTTVKNCTDYALFFPLLRLGKRFRAAPDSVSLYRQWSVKQAVRQDPMRIMRTRFELMRGSAEAFAADGKLTPKRKDSFEMESFKLLRSMARVNLGEAVGLHNELLERNPKFAPRTHSRIYNQIYAIFGFSAAEKIASYWHRLRPSRSLSSIDPKSGLPYC